MKQIDNLLRLMKENPDLPVVPFVDAEIVTGDDFGYWMGSFGASSIDEYILPLKSYESVIFKSDEDIFGTLEKLLSTEAFEALPETEKECKPFYDALPWKKAIIVYIETLGESQEDTK